MRRSPSPTSEMSISPTTMPFRACTAPRRSPSRTAGSAHGSEIRAKSAASPAPKARAISSSDRSVERTPTSVFTTTTKKENMKTEAATTVSRMPKRAISTGTRADSGADISVSTQAWKKCRTSGKRPMARPRATPSTAAGTNPSTSDRRLAAAARGRRPPARPGPAAPASRARRREGRPSLELPQDLPQAVDQPGELHAGPHVGLVARPGQRHLDHLVDPAGPRAEHDDAVGEVDRLLHAVGDEQHALP